MSVCTVMEFGKAGEDLVALLRKANAAHPRILQHPRIEYALTGLVAVVDWINTYDRVHQPGHAHLLAKELTIPSLAEPIHALPVFTAPCDTSNMQRAVHADHELAEVMGDYGLATGQFSMRAKRDVPQEFKVTLDTRGMPAIVHGPSAPLFVRTHNHDLVQSGSAILFDAVATVCHAQTTDARALHVVALVLLKRLSAEQGAATLRVDPSSWAQFLRTATPEVHRAAQAWVSAGHLEDEGRAQQVGDWIWARLGRQPSAVEHTSLVKEVAATLKWAAGFFAVDPRTDRTATPSTEMRSLGAASRSPFLPQSRRLDSQY